MSQSKVNIRMFKGAVSLTISELTMIVERTINNVRIILDTPRSAGDCKRFKYSSFDTQAIPLLPI